MRISAFLLTCIMAITLSAIAFADDKPLDVEEKKDQPAKTELPLNETTYDTTDYNTTAVCNTANGCGIAEGCGLTEGCGLGCGCSQKSGCLFGSESLNILPKNEDSCLFEGWKYSVGGELRYRYMDEFNRLRPAGSANRSTYNLWRFTPFMELKNEWVTLYVQGIDASIFGEDLGMLPIDENRADLLRAYVDVKIGDFDGALRYRYGRQFLKYGGQRLLSPLGWSNTFRNFEGHKLYYSNSDWNIDAFAMRPLNGAAAPSKFHPTSFDAADQSVWLNGVYATYKETKNSKLDFYWIHLNESQPNTNRHDGERHTIGMRYSGKYPVKSCRTVVRTYDWDVEGAYQFGKDDFVSGGASQDVKAGFVFASGGVTFNDLPWSPGVKGLFWWGSGDSDPNDGEINTVSTLYPLGHAYWGLIDNFNGSNLIDLSLQASVKPTKKLSLLAAWHWFDKAESDDYIYNIAGAPLGPLATSNRIGQELDFVATYKVHPDVTLQAGYFLFLYSGAVSKTALARSDADQFYFSAAWKF